MRSIADPFVVRLPAGARVRTRLRLTTADEAVLRVVGAHLGRLAGHDLAWRCRLGRSDNQRTLRKRAATSQSSSRWAGTITRTSNQQRQRGLTNLVNYRIGLRRAVDSIRTRLAVPVGGKQGRVNGYATQAERYAKQRRLRHLKAELATVEDRLSSARVSVCRGGHRLAKLRHRLDHVDVELTEADWQARWQAKRWFLTADGDATKHWGNETIRVHPEQQWMELRLPTPMADLFQHARSCLYLPSGMSGDLPPSTGRMGGPSGNGAGSLRHQLRAKPKPLVLGRFLADRGGPAAAAGRAAPKPSTRRGPECRASGLLGSGLVRKPGWKAPHHSSLPGRPVGQHPRWSATGGDRCAASAGKDEWMSLHRGRRFGFHRRSPDRPGDPWTWAPRRMVPQDHLGNAHPSLPNVLGRNGRQR